MPDSITKNIPAPKTFAPSREDVLSTLGFFFGDPAVPEKLKDYSEHHAMTCAPPASQTPRSKCSKRRHTPPTPAAPCLHRPLPGRCGHAGPLEPTPLNCRCSPDNLRVRTRSFLRPEHVEAPTASNPQVAHVHTHSPAPSRHHRKIRETLNNLILKVCTRAQNARRIRSARGVCLCTLVFAVAAGVADGGCAAVHPHHWYYGGVGRAALRRQASATRAMCARSLLEAASLFPRGEGAHTPRCCPQMRAFRACRPRSAGIACPCDEWKLHGSSMQS